MPSPTLSPTRTLRGCPTTTPPRTPATPDTRSTDLALVGYKPEAAAQRLRTAVEGHTSAYPRSRVFSRTRLASLTMAAGDPAEATMIGHQALDEVTKLHSGRAVDDVRQLAEVAAAHRMISEVTELRDRIKETIKT